MTTETVTPSRYGRGVKERILDALSRRGAIDPTLSEEIIDSFTGSQMELEKELTENYSVSPVDICLALAECAQVPALKVSTYNGTGDPLLKEFPPAMLKQHLAVPVSRTGKTITVALADPMNIVAIEEMTEFSGLKVMPAAALKSEINELINNIEEKKEDGLDEILQAAEDSNIEVALGEGQERETDIASILEIASDAPVVRIVNMILMEAINKHASDVHIESFAKQMRLRYRIDGILAEGPAPPKHLQSAIISRIKVMSELDIAERRVPQDGRFKIRADNKEIDLRISILPTVHGEKICMRLLDKSNLANSLEILGLDPDSLSKLRYAIHQPYGLILVTGPTGSGKTTTLYSALQELNSAEVNITTVENPVEYQLQGINQVEIRDAVGMSFAAALRSILRQDPDIVLVGETRDAETADIAVKAALTGHLVMTTLHTNDAPGAIARLAYMGIEPFLIASSLLLSQAQRLVRKICSNCKQEFKFSPEYAAANHIPYEIFKDVQIFQGRGCARCNQTGYKGRASIMEVLPISRELREMILRTTNTDDLKKLALEQGFRDLRENGFYRVREGITTIEEVLRVTAGDN